MAELDVPRFYERLDKIYSSFLKQKSGVAWNKANVICLNRAEHNEDDPYIKSVVLHQYLFGYELTDTILLLTDQGNVIILAAKKKCEFLKAAVNQAPEGSGIRSIKLFSRNKGDGNVENHENMMEEIRKCLEDKEGEDADGTLKVGMLQKEWKKNMEGKSPNVVGWQTYLEATEDVEFVDVNLGLALILSQKDSSELDLLKKSAVLSNKVLKHGFIPKLEDVIDKEESISHEALSSEVETILEDPSKINLKVPPENVQSSYYPIVQSGGEYDIRVSAQSTDKNLTYDIITVSLGARYQFYCSNISRTFLVDPPKVVSNNYEALLSVQEACLKAMKPGKPLKSVYAAAKNALEKEGREDLIGKLPKNLGFSTGLEFREGALVLSQKNPSLFRTGMVFNLSIGFSDLSLGSKAKASVHSKSAVKGIDTYALLISDTVVITDSSADILTKHNKNLTDISYTINEEEDDDAPNAPDGDAELARKLSTRVENADGTRSSARLATTYDSIQEQQAGAAERERKQIELMERYNEERIRELARAKNRKKGDGGESEKAEELETYSRSKDYPEGVLPNQVKVDMARKCVLLPIGGNPVPFHICTIKGVVLQNADAVTYLRINFYTAGMAVGKDASKNMAKLVEKYAPYASFIREMTFRSLDSFNLTQAYRMISELRKRFKQKEVQDEEEATLVKQDKLIRTKNERVPRLSDLTMRPVFAGRKTQGNLEAHSNGLRFVSSAGETVDIIYANIKSAIFQPCESDIMVLIHFHLKNPIMIGKKKQINIQVFTEVIDASQAVDAGRRSMYDPEEMDDEQRERQLRRKLNDAFKDFCRKVENVAKKNNFSLEFDIPYRDLGFLGNPHKEMVFIMPTLNCLVNLTETPFFVVDLSFVDHVHFERVTFASKAFDMVIINKDFTKQPWRVDMIQNTDKDSIQEWLTDMEISYTEGPMTLNWKQIMQTVHNDDRFYMNTEEDEVTPKEAGWSFLRMYGRDDESEEDSGGEDSDFNGNVEESEEDDDDDESDFDDESEDESDFDADEDLEEQGMDWEDMEKEAIRDDRRKGKDADDDGRRGSSKRRSSAKESSKRKRGRR